MKLQQHPGREGGGIFRTTELGRKKPYHCPRFLPVNPSSLGLGLSLYGIHSFVYGHQVWSTASFIALVRIFWVSPRCTAAGIDCVFFHPYVCCHWKFVGHESNDDMSELGSFLSKKTECLEGKSLTTCGLDLSNNKGDEILSLSPLKIPCITTIIDNPIKSGP